MKTKQWKCYTVSEVTSAQIRPVLISSQSLVLATKGKVERPICHLRFSKGYETLNGLVSVYHIHCRNNAVTQAMTTFSPVLAYQLDPPKYNVTCHFDELRSIATCIFWTTHFRWHFSCKHFHNHASPVHNLDAGGPPFKTWNDLCRNLYNEEFLVGQRSPSFRLTTRGETTTKRKGTVRVRLLGVIGSARHGMVYATGRQGKCLPVR